MNNNYNTKKKFEDLKNVNYVDGDSSSSDSEFSDGYDGRLDAEFNAMIKRIKSSKMVEEQQPIKTREKPGETNQLPENSIAVQKTHVVNGQVEIESFTNNPTSIAPEPRFVSNQSSGVSISTARHSMVSDSELNDSNWTDYESDETNFDMF